MLHSRQRGLPSYLCSAMFARAPVLGLSCCVTVNEEIVCAHFPLLYINCDCECIVDRDQCYSDLFTAPQACATSGLSVCCPLCSGAR